MQANSGDRLDRIEAALEQTLLLTQSNARSIQAFGEDVATFRLATEQTINRLDQTIERLEDVLVRVNETNEGVVNMLARQEETQPTILRKLNSIEGKVDQLLEQGRDIS